MPVETAVTFLRAMASSPQHRPVHCSLPTLSLFLKVLVIVPIRGGGGDTGVWLGPLLTPHTHPPTHVTRLGKVELLGPSLSQMCPLFVLSCLISPSLPVPIPSVMAALRGMNLGEDSLHSPASALPAPQEGVTPGT